MLEIARRFHSAAKILEDSRERGILRLGGIKNEDDVQKKMKSSLKKIQVQDLGNMRAQDLLASIPEEDPLGRGRKDLRDMEKKLSVKIVFGPGQGETHVYLVGDAKKLGKKVFCIRYKTACFENAHKVSKWLLI